MFAILVLVPTQVYAYTIVEFAIADRPVQSQNVTFTIEDLRLHEEYKWIQFNRNYEIGAGVSQTFSQRPDGVGTAYDDPVVNAEEYEPQYPSPYDNGFFTIINKTLEPGTPLTMCVSYNNNDNMTRCEYTAVADEGAYSVVNLQADVDAAKPPKFKGAS